MDKPINITNVGRLFITPDKQLDLNFESHQEFDDLMVEVFGDDWCSCSNWLTSLPEDDFEYLLGRSKRARRIIGTLVFVERMYGLVE